MPSRSRKRLQINFSNPFAKLTLLLVFVFLMGGSARADVQSLIVLQPLASVFLGIGLWSLTREQVARYSGLFLFMSACLALVASHLLPLPYEIWSNLPGRQTIVEVLKLAGVGRPWQPVSMVPYTTLNALYALIVPAAVFVLAVQLDEVERIRLVWVVIILCLFSAALGLLQAVSSSPTLYLYNVTNDGAPVGLFANRNHQAVVLALLFPMIAFGVSCLASKRRDTKLVNASAILVCATLIPLVIVTGSRAGLGLAACGLIAAFTLRVRLSRHQHVRASVHRRNLVLAVAGVTALVVLAYFSSRNEAIARLFSDDISGQDRGQFWPVIVNAANSYFPWGSGIGTFAEVYRIHEDVAMLRPQYLNHAHNDWLEIYLTGGVPAILVVAAGLMALALKIREIAASDSAVAGVRWLGVVVVVICLAASVVDYPLRTPIFISLFAIALVWLWADPTKSGMKMVAHDPLSR